MQPKADPSKELELGDRRSAQELQESTGGT